MSSLDNLEMRSSTSHSFVIKIWLAEEIEQTELAVWRGRITHIPSGENAIVQELNEVSEFITSYLESMGVKPTIRERVSRWAQQLRGQPVEDQSA